MKLLLAILFSQIILAQEAIKGSISGVITDPKNKETLVAVNISIVGTTTGTTSDESGKFELKDLNTGIYKLRFEYVGYQTYIEPDVYVRPARDTKLKIELSEDVLSGNEVLVEATYFRKSSSDPISVVSFNAEEIRRSPGGGGEITRILSALPSVSSRGENSQDIIVRGGSPTENLFIVDNIAIPSIRHFESQSGHSNGPIGIINSNLINDVQFYTGGFSPEYGNFLSSVTEVAYKDGSFTQLNGDASLDFAGFSFFLESPIVANKSSFFITGRRSYLDLISKLINSSGAPRFQDIQMKNTFRLTEKHHLNALFIYANSSFDGTDLEIAKKDEKTNLVNTSNDQYTAGTNWLATWSKDAYSTTSLSFTQRNSFLDITKLNQKTLETNSNNTLNNFIIRNKNYYSFSDKSNVEFGYELDYSNDKYNYFFKSDTIYSGEILPDITIAAPIKQQKQAAFINFNTSLLTQLNASIGMRLDYNNLNEKSNFGPRLKIRYDFDQTMSLSAGYARLYQSLPSFLTSANKEIEKLPSMQTDHFVLGLEKLLTEDSKISLEAYYKNYANMPLNNPKDDLYDPTYILDLRFGRSFNSLNSKGEGRSYGAELFYQKKLAKDFYGMVSFSYFRSEFKDLKDKWQRRDFDNKFLFSVIGGYKPNETHEFSFRWSYIGSQPYTPIDESASIATRNEVRDLNKYNSIDLPAYHSLYFRYDYRIAFESTNLITYFSLWNAYNRENIVAKFWNKDLNKIVDEKNFAILPVGGVKYEF
jgi:outer membrane receptor for ferrienterochelin and colicin